jgi:hypothetical protein
MGEGHTHGDRQVNLDGTCAHGSNPWLKQFADDVMYARQSGIFVMPTISFSQLLENEVFMRSKFLQLRSFAMDDAELPVRAEVDRTYEMSCTVCNRLFPHARALQIHCAMIHGERMRHRMLRMTYQCPWCLWIFTTSTSLRSHYAARLARGSCPHDLKHPRAQLCDKLPFFCPRCKYRALTTAEYHEHLRQFLHLHACIFAEPLVAAFRDVAAVSEEETTVRHESMGRKRRPRAPPETASR